MLFFSLSNIHTSVYFFTLPFVFYHCRKSHFNSRFKSRPIRYYWQFFKHNIDVFLSVCLTVCNCIKYEYWWIFKKKVLHSLDNNDVTVESKPNEGRELDQNGKLIIVEVAGVKEIGGQKEGVEEADFIVHEYLRNCCVTESNSIGERCTTDTSVQIDR